MLLKILGIMFGCCLLFVISLTRVWGQTPIPSFDEITVDLTLNKVGTTEINALLSDRIIYIPITELFDFLRIDNRLSLNGDLLSGFFLNATDAYRIDYLHHHATIKNLIINIKNDEIIKHANSLYLRADVFSRIFGFSCQFKMNILAVIVNSDLDFPIIRELRQEKIRKNLQQLKGNIKADSAIGRTFPVFQTGMADWSVTNQLINEKPNYTRLYMRAGAMIAGGETSITANYQTNYPFSEQQLNYSWRLVTNNALVQQITLGKIYINSIATLYAPIIGLTVTNAPAVSRQSYGTYTINAKTNPDWIVELYINNILVNYIKTDATGIYRLDIPLQYGGSTIKLQFYGPLGEQTSSEQFINIPFNFIRKGELQYNANFGLTDDASRSLYSKVDLDYGINRHVTVGAGTEYLSSNNGERTIPYVNLSISMLSGLLLSAESDYDVRNKVNLYYRLSSGLNLQFSDTWYHFGQTAINNDYTQEQQIQISAPFHILKKFIYSSLNIDRSLTMTSGFNSVNWQLSTSLGFIGYVAINTSASVAKGYNYISTMVSTTKTIGGFMVRPAFQYNYIQRHLTNISLSADKAIKGNSYLSLSYNNYFGKNGGVMNIGFRRTFAVAQVSVSAQLQQHLFVISQTASGGFAAAADGKYLNFNNHSNVGTSSVILRPFLDLNNNGRRDDNEPMVPGIKVMLKGGLIKENLKDTVVEISNLQPYVSYNIQIDNNSIGMISWKIKNSVLNVNLSADIIKVIDVPVSITGEVSGWVYLGKSKPFNAGHITINFYDASKKFAGSTVTENDGSFSYLGLMPGKYTASLDTAWLKRLNVVAAPTILSFSIKVVKEGDLVEGLDFTLPELSANSLPPAVNLQLLHTISGNDNVKSSLPDDKHPSANPSENIRKSNFIKAVINPHSKFVNMQISHKKYKVAACGKKMAKKSTTAHLSTKKAKTVFAHDARAKGAEWYINILIYISIWITKHYYI